MFEEKFTNSIIKEFKKFYHVVGFGILGLILEQIFGQNFCKPSENHGSQGIH